MSEPTPKPASRPSSHHPGGPGGSGHRASQGQAAEPLTYRPDSKNPGMRRDSEAEVSSGVGNDGLGEHPGAGQDGALGQRILARLQERAWQAGHERRTFHRQAAGEEVAAWDEARPRQRRLDEDPAMDRGPGLAPGRDRPGPTRFDPRTGKRELERAIADRGWAGKLAMAQIAVNWQQIVGAQIAEHCEVVGFEEGRLDVRATSSAWAQQLRLMAPHIHGAVMRELERLHPASRGAAVDIRIYGPSVPSWGHGRFGPARGGVGPRDTYG